VTVLRRLDRTIRDATEGGRSLDDVVRLLAQHSGPVTTDGFRLLAEQVAGVPLDEFFRRYVPG
jgi:predicted metalloprotease with PDZ domain